MNTLIVSNQLVSRRMFPAIHSKAGVKRLCSHLNYPNWLILQHLQSVSFDSFLNLGTLLSYMLQHIYSLPVDGETALCQDGQISCDQT